jgi:putative phage-type endonuclease
MSFDPGMTNKHLNTENEPNNYLANTVAMSIIQIPSNVDVSTLHPKVIDLFKRPQYEQRTAEWFAVRRGLITASEAAAALGVKPFAGFKGCPREELMQTKLNKPGHFSGMAMSHGTFYESEACEHAMKILGKRQFEFGLLVHPDYPWLAASPDGITADGYCLELKCPMRRKIVPGEVPHHYESQIQIQMEVCDMEETIFAQYKPAHMCDGDEPYMDITIVKRDREWFARNLPILKLFHDEMEERRLTHVPQEPPPDENVCEIDEDMYSVEREYVREFCEFDVPCNVSDDMYSCAREYAREFSDDVFLKSAIV